jgi:N-acetylmuramoyl-L-alanine amidase
MPTSLSRIVLDPAHGGVRPEGGSSPNRALGPNGLVERDLALDVARRAARLLAAYGDIDVRLTRHDDRNLALAERARVAREAAADVFVSLHFNGAPDPQRDGTEVYVARDASPNSTALARVVGDRVASAACTRPTVVRRDLGVLLADRHAPETSACLVELAYLTNPQQAERLAGERHRESIAAALAQAIHSHVIPGAQAHASSSDYNDGYSDDDGTVTTLDVYAGNRVHAASADPALFVCTPDPVAVDDATWLPTPTATADDATRGALTTLGLSAAQVRAFVAAGGLVPMRPIAAACGQDMLIELLRRLRYTPAQLRNPPHSWGANLNARLGVPRRQRLLASRVLLAVPGHFRQLARRTSDAVEAHTLETLGWLFAYWLRDRVDNATNKSWWLPPSPDWVAAFPNPLPFVDSELHRLIMRIGQIDDLMEFGSYRSRQQAWENGLPGQQWKREIGGVAGIPAGRPFYPQIVHVPAAPNIAAHMAQIRARFAQHVQQVQNASGVNTNETTATLHRCRNNLVTALNLVTRMSLGAIELTTGHPLLASQRRRTTTSLEFMTAIHPLASAMFATIHDLGWNDLLYNTEGSFCFRGIKRDAAEADFHTAATHISDHAFGIAIDVNVAENPRRNAHSTIDPRIVALVEAFHFQWGKCFAAPDPMHFQFDDRQGQQPPAPAPAQPTQPAQPAQGPQH